MELNRLFELVRSGNCIIWAGAGLSKYAGFPLGGQIADYLNEKLGENKHPQGALLKDVASTYEKVFGRELLIQTIRDRFFKQPPSSYEVHGTLSKIPHFKIILTTNFDFLFELSYQNRLVKIASPADFIKISDARIVLVKLHGDFSSPAHLVITDADYVNFFTDTSNSLLYNYVLNQLALYNVIFLGYSFGDLNASTIFEKINRDLGPKRKEWFLISPGLKDYQVEDFKKKNITCINLTGEEFVQQLEKHINQNIIADINKGQDPSVISQYLFHRQLQPTIEFGPEGQKLREIKTLADKAAAIQLTFKTTVDVRPTLKKFRLGEIADPLELTEQNLQEFSMEVNGVLMSQIQHPVSLRIGSTPVAEESVDVHFGNKSIEDVKYQVFSTSKAWAFRLAYENFAMKVEFKKPFSQNNRGSINISVDNTYKELAHAMRIAEFMLFVSEGKSFDIVKGADKIPLQFFTNKTEHDKALYFLEHFKHLENIERYYDIRFKEFTVTSEDIHEARRLSALINGETLPYENICGVFNQSEIDTEALKQIHRENSMITLEVGEAEPLTLYGNELPIENLVVQVFDTVVQNLDDFLDNKTREVSFGSKTNSINAHIHRQKKAL